MKKFTQFCFFATIIGLLFLNTPGFSALFVLQEGNHSIVTHNKFSFISNGNIESLPLFKAEPAIQLIQHETLMARPGQEIIIPVILNQAEKVGAISMVIQFPFHDIDIVKAEPAISSGFSDFTVKDGQLRFSWFSLDAMNMEAGDQIVWITARLKDGIATGKSIELALDESSELANEEAKVLSGISISIPIVKSTLTSVKHTITVANYSFTPSDLTGVIVGDTVEWVRIEGTHTTTSTQIPAGSPGWDVVLSSGSAKYQYKVVQPGVYNYVCLPHESMGMIGKFTATVGSGVGIADLTRDVLMMEISPNPTISDCQVVFTSSVSETGEMKLSDMLGNVIIDKKIQIVNGKNLEILSVQGLSSGLYQLQMVTANGKVVAKKLIKP